MGEANLFTNEDLKVWSEKANTRFDRHEERLDELQKEMRELKTGRSAASEKASEKAARAAGEEAATITWQKREQSKRQAAPVRHLLHVRGFAPFECEAEKQLSKDDAKKLGEASLDPLPDHKAAQVQLLEPFLQNFQIHFQTLGDMSREESGAFCRDWQAAAEASDVALYRECRTTLRSSARPGARRLCATIGRRKGSSPDLACRQQSMRSAARRSPSTPGMATRAWGAQQPRATTGSGFQAAWRGSESSRRMHLRR